MRRGSSSAFEKADDQCRVSFCGNRGGHLQAKFRLESGSIRRERLPVLTRIRLMKPPKASQIRRDVVERR